jgi:hypothetical protein
MDQFNNNDEFLDFLFSKVAPIKDELSQLL